MVVIDNAVEQRTHQTASGISLVQAIQIVLETMDGEGILPGEDCLAEESLPCLGSSRSRQHKPIGMPD